MVPHEVDGDDFCYLTTTGRSTGRPHTIEIWFARVGEAFFLLAGGGERSDWVRNLQADPSVMVRFRNVEHPATAVVVAADVDGRTAGVEKYQARYDGDLTSWRDTALPVRLDVAGG